MSSGSEIILNSSLNKTSTTTMQRPSYHQHHTRRSFHLSSETIQEEETLPPPAATTITPQTLPEENENITNYIKRHTPILFSTNRGLHLRTTNTLNNNITVATTSSHNSASQHSSVRNTNSSTLRNSNYNIAFCDLERWSTNRANTISLEDTFTIPKPAVVPSSAASGSLASTSLRFLPHKSGTGVRFSGYSRFDVE